MAVDDTGDWGQPNFLASGAPEIDVDPSAVADYFAAMVARRFANWAALVAAGAPPADGYMARVDTIPGAFFLRTSGAWVMHGVARFGDAAARTAAITSPAPGMRSHLEDSGTDFEYIGTTWTPVGGTMPYVDYVRATAQSIPNASSTTVDWDNTPAAILGTWPEASGVITVPYTGKYLVTLVGAFAAHGSATGTTRRVALSKNGTTTTVAVQQTPAPAATAEQGMTLTAPIPLTAGDTIQARVIHNAGLAIGFGAPTADGTGECRLSLEYVGPR